MLSFIIHNNTIRGMAGVFECKKCKMDSRKDENKDQAEQPMKDIGRVDRFCYLGDVINSGGCCEIAVARRNRFPIYLGKNYNAHFCTPNIN